MKKILFVFGCLLFSSTWSKAQLSVNWIKTLESNYAVAINDLALDITGNIYACGSFNDSMNISSMGGQYITNSINSSDIVIMKFNPQGNLIWLDTIISSGYDEAKSIFVDNAGSIYVTGGFSNSADFDPGSSSFSLTSGGQSDIFILKLDWNGNFMWAKSLGSSYFDTGSQIIVDNQGDLYCVGRFGGNTDFDPGPGTFIVNGGSNGSSFALKLTAFGNFLWAASVYGGSASCVTTDIAANVFIGGYFTNYTDFDPGANYFNVMPSGYGDAYILKLNSSGNFMQVNSFGGNNTSLTDCISHVQLDNYGNLIAIGQVTSTCDVDPGPGIFNVTSNGKMDVVAMKINSVNNLIWARSWGGSLYDYCNDLAIDSAGNCYLTGIFSDTVDFDPGAGNFQLISSGTDDAFIQKLNASGNLVWAYNFGCNYTFTQNADEGLAILLDVAENIYTSGANSSSSDIDPTSNVLIANAAGAYITKLNQDSCASLTVSIDSVTNLSCLANGNLFSSADGGFPPYAFQWNTPFQTNSASTTSNTPGIFTVVVTDSLNCTTQRSVILNGPDSLAGYNLAVTCFANDFRPGFPSAIFCDVQNKLCDTISGTVKVIIDPLLTYTGFNLIPDYISGDTLTWNIISFNSDSGLFHIKIFVNTSISAQIGDTITIVAFSDPTISDIDTSNNITIMKSVVVNGYDPNDKQVYPFGSCPEHYILNNQKLTYAVRFQNTGNSNAININVLDSLDSDLDLNSVRVIANSHPLITEVLPGNVLKFRFDNIMLPDSGSNEPASHGYVIYEVDPLPSLPNGTEIKNHADIYFDFNPPVITNTVLNTIIDSIPDCNITTGIVTHLETGIKIYPNPAKDFFRIENITPGSTINLYDISGRLIKSQKNNTADCTIATEFLQNGIFVIEIKNETSRLYKKVVINK